MANKVCSCSSYTQPKDCFLSVPKTTIVSGEITANYFKGGNAYCSGSCHDNLISEQPIRLQAATLADACGGLSQ